MPRRSRLDNRRRLVIFIVILLCMHTASAQQIEGLFASPPDFGWTACKVQAYETAADTQPYILGTPFTARQAAGKGACSILALLALVITSSALIITALIITTKQNDARKCSTRVCSDQEVRERNT